MVVVGIDVFKVGRHLDLLEHPPRLPLLPHDPVALLPQQLVLLPQQPHLRVLRPQPALVRPVGLHLRSRDKRRNGFLGLFFLKAFLILVKTLSCCFTYGSLESQKRVFFVLKFIILFCFCRNY